MNNTTTVHTRMDTELKQNVEIILNQLGLTHSDAIKLFYKKIKLNGGLPFEIKILDKLLAEKMLLKELEKGEKSSEPQGWFDI